MATLAQVRNQVLQELNIIAPDQTAGQMDVNTVEAKYNQWHALWTEKNRLYWSDTDDIPTEAVQPVVAILADLLSRPFRVDPNLRAELAAQVPQATRDLVLLNKVDYQSSETKVTDY